MVIKEKLPPPVICIFIAISIVVGCMDNLSEINQTFSPDAPISVEEARIHFDSFVEEFYVSPEKSNKTRNNDYCTATPVWTKAKAMEYYGEKIIEIPINGPITSILQIENPGDSIASRKKNINTVAKLIATKNNGNISFNIVRITAEEKYLLKKNRNIMKFTLNNLSDFSGAIRYYDFMGKLLYGDIYKHGSITGSIANAHSEDETNKKAQTRGIWVEECHTRYYLVENYWCWGFMDGELLVTTGCELTDWWIEEETTCELVEQPGEEENLCPTCGSNDCSGNCSPGENPDTEFNKLINNIIFILRSLDIKIPENITIKKSTKGCITNLRTTKEGEIEVCPQFFGKNIKDQTAMMYHEMLHIEKKHHSKKWQGTEQLLENVFILKPPPHIDAYIRSGIEKDLKDEENLVEISEAEKKTAYDLTINHLNILPPEYYYNEIEVYKEEMKNITDVTPEYQLEREYNLWKHEQMYEKSSKEYKK